MGRRGFTLIEILVAITICMVLTAIATIPYRQLLSNYRSESQMRMFHTELLQARIRAVNEHKEIKVRVYPDRFFIYSSGNSRAGVEPLVKRTLNFPVFWAFAYASADDPYCEFSYDVKGFLDLKGSICIDSYETGAVDSIVISSTRTALGKRQTGKGCKDAFITIR